MFVNFNQHSKQLYNLFLSTSHEHPASLIQGSCLGYHHLLIQSTYKKYENKLYLTVLSPTNADVAPRCMIGAAFGQQTPNVCTWAITSCLRLFSSSAALSKSMLLKLASISLICSSVISKPKVWNQQNLKIKTKNYVNINREWY